MRGTGLATIFAIDTAADRCHLGLARDGNIVSVSGPVGQTHLEHVLPLIEGLFAQCALSPQQCDAFAFASGPGSFTGLRVACTLVQGMALGACRPVIALGNLGLLACAAAMAAPSARKRRILALLDARMQQAYWGVYEGAGTDWEELAPPALCDLEAMDELISRWQPELCAGDPVWLGRTPVAGRPVICPATIDGDLIAQMAQLQFAAGKVLPAHRALPVYVRDQVALTVAQRRQARAGASSSGAAR